MSEHLSNELLIDYLRKELAPEDDALVLAHLEACTACRREHEIEASLGEALRSAALRDELEFPSMIKARVWEAVRNAKPTPVERLMTYFRPALAVPVAAALAIGLFFATPTMRAAMNPQKIDATYYLEAHAALQAQSPFTERGPAAAQLIEMGQVDAGTPTDLADASHQGLAASGAFDAVK